MSKQEVVPGALDLLDEMVRLGEGPIEIGLTENGDIGVWLPDSTKADGEGDTVAEAINATFYGDEDA